MSITIDNITLTDEQVQSVIEQSKNKKGFWEPAYGESYYYVDTGELGLRVTSYGWMADDFDLYRLSEGNCFETEKEAKKHKTYLEALQRVRLYVMENHYFEPDWSDMEQKKFSIAYNSKLENFEAVQHGASEMKSVLPYIDSYASKNEIEMNCEDDLKIIFNI